MIDNSLGLAWLPGGVTGERSNLLYHLVYHLIQPSDRLSTKATLCRKENPLAEVQSSDSRKQIRMSAVRRKRLALKWPRLVLQPPPPPPSPPSHHHHHHYTDSSAHDCCQHRTMLCFHHIPDDTSVTKSFADDHPRGAEKNFSCLCIDRVQYKIISLRSRKEFLMSMYSRHKIINLCKHHFSNQVPDNICLCTLLCSQQARDNFFPLLKYSPP